MIEMNLNDQTGHDVWIQSCCLHVRIPLAFTRVRVLHKYHLSRLE